MPAFYLRLRQNWKSGLAVALVSVPLSISLAIAANATPLMGIITAVWAGLIAAIFGGSNFNITGPTGALSGILATYAITHGVGALPALSVLTGVIILVSYLFRLERYIIFIPSSVIHGFTLGVAFIIGLNQLNFALGLSGLEAHERFIFNVWESLQNVWQTDLASFVIFLLGLGLLFACLKFFPKLPGPIPVALLGIFLGLLSSKGLLGFSLQTISTRYGNIEQKLWEFPSLSFNFLDGALWKTATAVALIAILETLLSGKIADAMTRTKFNQHKETLGLGLANIASGLMGGLPATAALARTSLNIKSGANHKTSSIISILFVAIISLLFLSFFNYLPLAVVASILVYVSIRMISREHFNHLWEYDKPAFALSMIVAIITIAEDPIVGILVGSTAALLMFVKKLSKGQAEVTLNKNKKIVARIAGEQSAELGKYGAELAVYRFSGQMTYINSQSHLETLGRLDDEIKIVILSFRSLFYIDLDGIDALAEIVDTLHDKGKRVLISAPGPFIIPLLKKSDWYRKKQEMKEVFEHTHEALKHLGYLIK